MAGTGHIHNEIVEENKPDGSEVRDQFQGFRVVNPDVYGDSGNNPFIVPDDSNPVPINPDIILANEALDDLMRGLFNSTVKNKMLEDKARALENDLERVTGENLLLKKQIVN